MVWSWVDQSCSYLPFELRCSILHKVYICLMLMRYHFSRKLKDYTLKISFSSLKATFSFHKITTTKTFKCLPYVLISHFTRLLQWFIILDMNNLVKGSHHYWMLLNAFFVVIIRFTFMYVLTPGGHFYQRLVIHMGSRSGSTETSTEMRS